MFCKKNVMTLCILGLIALSFGLLLSHHNRPDKTKYLALHGTYLEHPRKVSAFTLTDTDNKPFDNKSLQGEWTMVFFGFTSCGYLCPTTLAEMGKMYRLLEQQGVKKLPKVVLISLDPERDSIEKLKEYVKAFHPHFEGARGTAPMIQNMTKEMGIAYAQVAIPDVNDQKAYDIQHTGTILLFNPEGQLSMFFTSPHKADLLAEDYALLVG
jgi:protein SCO1